ncbi:MAG TPA: CvpA family protein [Alphaproteobacteria bacterium]|jgi:membrane protein required for colicin V production|nr:CvpA family protein [Alphaproteobacteria bacterium]
MNTIDIIVIAVVALSALIAFLRGFVREVLTIGSWLAASLVTLYGFPLLQGKFEQWISNKMAADIVCGISLFLVTLIVFSILSHMVAGFVRGSALTAVDRSLGLLFGLVRGAILVSLAYMLLLWADPNMLRDARTTPMMARGAEILRDLAPKELADDLPADLHLPAPPADDSKRDAAAKPIYNRKQNDDMQRLIDATSGK